MDTFHSVLSDTKTLQAKILFPMIRASTKHIMNWRMITQGRTAGGRTAGGVTELHVILLCDTTTAAAVNTAKAE